MPRHVPSHRTLLASVESAIGRYSRHLRASLLRQRDGIHDMDFAASSQDEVQEMQWLFANDWEWQNMGFNHPEKRDGDQAYALVRLMELREKLLKAEPWPAREEA